MVIPLLKRNGFHIEYYQTASCCNLCCVFNCVLSFSPGVPGSKLAELHGNVFVEKCEKCGARYDRDHYVLDDVGSQYYEEMADFGKSDTVRPRHSKKCELCGLSHRTGRNCTRKVTKENFP